MADTVHSSMNDDELHTIEREYAGTPHGNVSGIEGQYCRDTTTEIVYRNTDGTYAVPTTNWSAIVYPMVDEDTMVSDSASKWPSQQSVKAYVDTEVASAASPRKLLTLGNPWIWPGKMPMIKTSEMDNNTDKDTAGVTEITVSAIDTDANTITLSWVPYIDSLFSPTANKEWVIINTSTWAGAEPSRTGDAADILVLDSGDYATRVFSYTVAKGAEGNWSNGHTLVLVNPFEHGWTHYASNPVIGYDGGSSWRQQYVLGIGMFQHSDGTYRMLVSGTNSNLNYCDIGAFSSSDFFLWTALNSDSPYFSAGGATWYTNGIFASPGIHKLPNEDRYICCASGYSTKWKLGYIKFNEDFDAASLEFSAAEIIDSSGSSSGFYGACICPYGGRWYLAYCDRNDNDNPDSSTSAWMTKIAISNTPEGPYTYDSTVLTGRLTLDGSPRSSHTDHHGIFVWRGKLCLVIGTTARYNWSGTKANRVYSLYWYDEFKNAWVEDHRNPIFTNAVYGDEGWGAAYTWEKDHVGTAPQFWVDNASKRLYLFYVANSSSDRYQIGVAYMDLETEER